MEFRKVTCPICNSVLQAPVGASSVRCMSCKKTLPINSVSSYETNIIPPTPQPQHASVSVNYQQTPTPTPVGYQQAPAPTPVSYQQTPTPNSATADAPVQTQLSAIEKYMQIMAETQQLETQIHDLTNKRRAKETVVFRTYIQPETKNSQAHAYLVFDCIAIIVSLCIFGGTFFSWIALLVLLGTGAISYFVIRHSIKLISQAKNDIAFAKANYDVEKETFEREKTDEIHNIDNQISLYQLQIKQLSANDPLKTLLPQYKTEETLNYIYNALITKQAATIQQAVFMYTQAKKVEQRAESARQEEQQRQQQAFEHQRQMERERQEFERQQLEIQRQQQEQQLQQSRTPITVNVNSPQPQIQQIQPIPASINSAPSRQPVPLECPQCGNRREWVLINEVKEGYNVGAAVVGTLFLGPFGPLVGAIGHRIKTYRCRSCGFTRQYKE